MRKTASLRSAATGTFFAAVLSKVSDSVRAHRVDPLDGVRRSVLVERSPGANSRATGEGRRLHPDHQRSHLRWNRRQPQTWEPAHHWRHNQKDLGLADPAAAEQTIDGGGRVLMPGLTDAHWHMTMAAATPADRQQADTGLMYVQNLRFP